MRRLLATGFACVLGLAIMASEALAADVALVIGNNKYRKAPEALAAVEDARDVAAALEAGGYDVTLKIDLNRNEMRRELARFGRKLRRADRVVFFFSGHAIRADGVSYLAPVDQENDSLVEVMLDGVPLDLVLKLAAERAGNAVVFIDAAQLDGFTPTRFAEPGLAPIDPGQGVLVVSAAAPGQAIPRRRERGSRFGRDVVEEFLDPGTRVSRAVRRLSAPAWVVGDIDPRLELVPRGRGPLTGGRGDGRDMSPAEIEDRLSLSYGQRRDIQEKLSLLGFDPRGIDGAFGPGTRTAIRLWQRSHNIEETGYLSDEQIAMLEQDVAGARGGGGGVRTGDQDDAYWSRTGAAGTADGYRAYLERYSDGQHAAEAREALKQLARSGADAQAERERRDWREARLGDVPAGYRDYIARYPTGIWLPEAKERLSLLGATPAPTLDPEAAENALGLTRNDRLSIEQRLNYLGFPPGNQDGFFDTSARRAIEDYQRSRRLNPTGYLDQRTAAGIMEETKDLRTGIILDGAAVLRELLRGLE